MVCVGMNAGLEESLRSPWELVSGLSPLEVWVVLSEKAGKGLKAEAITSDREAF